MNNSVLTMLTTVYIDSSVSALLIKQQINKHPNNSILVSVSGYKTISSWPALNQHNA